MLVTRTERARKGSRHGQGTPPSPASGQVGRARRPPHFRRAAAVVFLRSRRHAHGAARRSDRRVRERQRQRGAAQRLPVHAAPGGHGAEPQPLRHHPRGQPLPRHLRRRSRPAGCAPGRDPCVHRRRGLEHARGDGASGLARGKLLAGVPAQRRSSGDRDGDPGRDRIQRPARVRPVARHVRGGAARTRTARRSARPSPCPRSTPPATPRRSRSRCTARRS